MRKPVTRWERWSATIALLGLVFFSLLLALIEDVQAVVGWLNNWYRVF